LINIERKREAESDYDTAVDLSHWCMSESIITLQTPAGLHILMTERFESVTHSYLEPDFDHFEASGETVYQSHADKSGDREKTELCIRFEIPRLLPKLSIDDFAEIEGARRCGFSDLLSNPVEDYLGITEWGDSHSSQGCHLSVESLRSIFEATDQITIAQKGFIVSVPAAYALVRLIRDAELKMLDVCSANLITKIHNNCEKAKFEIRGMTSAAMLDLFSRDN